MRILIADDGSDGGAQAVALTASLDWPKGSALRAISVFEPLPLSAAGPWSSAMVPSPEMERAVREQIAEINDNAIKRLASPHRDADGVVRQGRAATAIVDEAREFRADLVIVGSRGHGKIASLLLGSVSNEVVDQAPCPVLVARTPAASRVVFATDGSQASSAAEAVLTTWPIFAALPIHVVSVAEVEFPWTSGIAPTMIQAVVDAYTAELSKAREVHQELADAAGARLRAAGRSVEMEMREGGAAAEILTAAAAANADLIILCTPVGAFHDLLRQAAPAVSDACILTDVGSTKRSIVRLAESILGDSAARFVGSHPMAGSEKRGIDFARANLFDGARCITTPTPRTDPGALQRVESFWRALGMQVGRLSPADHDRLVCDISHLPHAVAAALVAHERRTPTCRTGQRLVEDRLDALPLAAAVAHDCGVRPTDMRRYSQARADCHSRVIVARDNDRMAATSSSDSPPKYFISTI
jgi:nucleotide-binding universal stress UspA family protein